MCKKRNFNQQHRNRKYNYCNKYSFHIFLLFFYYVGIPKPVWAVGFGIPCRST
ncbi:MAG: hypothetical protein LBH59_10345 [Planctomycetaceae bacterium]|nr:hypothetical protein [Planctomycetaceae bacterium]